MPVLLLQQNFHCEYINQSLDYKYFATNITFVWVFTSINNIYLTQDSNVIPAENMFSRGTPSIGTFDNSSKLINTRHYDKTIG